MSRVISCLTNIRLPFFPVCRPLTEGGKRTFFVVNTVALAKQQAEFLSRSVPYDTSIYTSDRNVDTWKHDKWLEEFAKYQVSYSVQMLGIFFLMYETLSSGCGLYVPNSSGCAEARLSVD